MKKTDNRILELADLQKVLLSTCTYLNRPIRKNQLIKMTTELFECNTAKEVEFALLDLIEQGKLHIFHILVWISCHFPCIHRR